MRGRPSGECGGNRVPGASTGLGSPSNPDGNHRAPVQKKNLSGLRTIKFRVFSAEGGGSRPVRSPGPGTGGLFAGPTPDSLRPHGQVIEALYGESPSAGTLRRALTVGSAALLPFEKKLKEAIPEAAVVN